MPSIFWFFPAHEPVRHEETPYRSGLRLTLFTKDRSHLPRLSLVQVLHIRNLPYETTEEELRELCSAFGPIVQTKLNVGANKNQAFVEFPELNMAINMVSYYANSADPAKVSNGCCLLIGVPARTDYPRLRSFTPGHTCILLCKQSDLLQVVSGKLSYS